MVWMKKRQNAGLNRLTEDVQTIIDTIREEYGGMSGNYQMCIDTSLGEDYVLNIVLDLVKNVNRHVSGSRAE